MLVALFRPAALALTIAILLLAIPLVACGAAGEPAAVSHSAPPPAAPAAAGSSAPAFAPASAASDAVTEKSAEESDSSSSQTAAGLTAGEVDDNGRWQEYLNYRSRYRGPPVHNVDVSERHIIRVQDAAGRGIPDALVRVSANRTPIFEGRTYADGRTLFFPRAFDAAASATSFRVYAAKGAMNAVQEMEREQGAEWIVSLDGAPGYQSDVPLDVLFLLDATGSMADEIDRIKSTLVSIAERISDLPSQPDLRLGMVTYRDRGDDFVTRLYDFQSDAPQFANDIRSVVADGGGDTPESLNEALHAAVNQPDWRRDDAVRLVFLVADAPPHLDYPQDYDYAAEMMTAHRKGIKIFAVASSGLDAQGEYIFRQIAQHTMGRFIFILYGGDTPHDVGQYSVERLDDLVVRLVQEELAPISR